MQKAIEIMKAKRSAAEIGQILDMSRFTGWRVLKGKVDLTQTQITKLVASISGLKAKDFYD